MIPEMFFVLIINYGNLKCWGIYDFKFCYQGLKESTDLLHINAFCVKYKRKQIPETLITMNLRIPNYI